MTHIMHEFACVAHRASEAFDDHPATNWSEEIEISVDEPLTPGVDAMLASVIGGLCRINIIHIKNAHVRVVGWSDETAGEPEQVNIVIWKDTR